MIKKDAVNPSPFVCLYCGEGKNSQRQLNDHWKESCKKAPAKYMDEREKVLEKKRKRQKKSHEKKSGKH